MPDLIPWTLQQLKINQVESLREGELDHLNCTPWREECNVQVKHEVILDKKGPETTLGEIGVTS